jgi:hypothetical protein
VMRVIGASIRPARIHPPTRPNTSRKGSAIAAIGANAQARGSIHPRLPRARCRVLRQCGTRLRRRWR